MRLDRWFKAHYPGLLRRAAELTRTDRCASTGKRCDTSSRIEPGNVARAAARHRR